MGEQTKAYKTIKVRKLGYALGGEITGVDFAKPISDETIAEIRAAWLDNLIAVFPNAVMTPEEHIAFSKRFYDLAYTPGLLPRFMHPDHPEIFMVSNIPRDGKPSELRHTARTWHSDQSFMQEPCIAAMLHCQQTPQVGGDTMFTNMYMAYEALSDKMKEVLSGMKAVHNYGAIRSFVHSNTMSNDELDSLKAAVHPVVRTHPETGRKALYVSEGMTERFDGMTVEESLPLLRFLWRHSTQPAFTYRHSWKPKDMIFWDNRCTMHLAPPDYDIDHMERPENHRHMFRTTLGNQAVV